MPALVPHEYATGPGASAVEFIVDPAKFPTFAGASRPNGRGHRHNTATSRQHSVLRSATAPLEGPAIVGSRSRPAIGLPAPI